MPIEAPQRPLTKCHCDARLSNAIYEIVSENGQLTARSTVGSAPLAAPSQDAFFHRPSWSWLKFERDAQGRVEHLLWQFDGRQVPRELVMNESSPIFIDHERSNHEIHSVGGDNNHFLISVLEPVPLSVRLDQVTTTARIGCFACESQNHGRHIQRLPSNKQGGRH